MLLVSAGFIIYFLRNRKLGWRHFWLGALAWVVTVVLKFAWAIPINTPVYHALTQALPLQVSMPLVYLYVGMLTGFFEVGLTYLFFRFTRFGKASWKQALAFGVGFGTIEAVLLGFVSLATVISAMINQNVTPLDTMSGLMFVNNLFYSLAPVVERFFTIWVHIICNLLLFYAILKGEIRWFWLSFAYKSLIDTFAAYGQITGIETLGKLWAIEGIVAIWGLLAWFAVDWLRQRYSIVDEQNTIQ